MNMVKRSMIGMLSGLLVLGLPGMARAKPAVKYKYTVEHGVKVYRNAPSPAQLAHRQRIARQAMLARRQSEARKRAERQARLRRHRAVEAAFERGYDRGYRRGVQQEHKRHARYRRNRYHYGRRYSTSYFGYPLNRYSRFSTVLLSGNPHRKH